MEGNLKKHSRKLTSNLHFYNLESFQKSVNFYNNIFNWWLFLFFFLFLFEIIFLRLPVYFKEMKWSQFSLIFLGMRNRFINSSGVRQLALYRCVRSISFRPPTFHWIKLQNEDYPFNSRKRESFCEKFMVTHISILH